MYGVSPPRRGIGELTKQILDLISQGRSKHAIADALHITRASVQQALRRDRKKASTDPVAKKIQAEAKPEEQRRLRNLYKDHTDGFDHRYSKLSFWLEGNDVPTFEEWREWFLGLSPKAADAYTEDIEFLAWVARQEFIHMMIDRSSYKVGDQRCFWNPVTLRDIPIDGYYLDFKTRTWLPKTPKALCKSSVKSELPVYDPF